LNATGDDSNICQKSEDQFVQNAVACNAGYKALITDSQSTITNLEFGEQTCIVITELTDPEWYVARYGDGSGRCEDATDFIEKFINFYDKLYGEIDNPQDQNSIIKQAVMRVEELSR